MIKDKDRTERREKAGVICFLFICLLTRHGSNC